MIRATLAALAFLASPVFAAVEIAEVTSPGGISAWLVEDHSNPFVALEIRFKGGASLDDPEKRGAVNLMTGLIEEGAGDMDARGFAEAQEELAASFSFDVYDDVMTVSAKFLTENRDEAVALLRTALTAPRFDADAIERVRGQVLSIVRADEKDPGEIAGRAFDRMAFGDHPYGSDLNGTEDSVSALTRDDIVDAYGRVMARDRVHVGAVGDISAGELGAVLDALLGDLPETGAPMPGMAGLSFVPGVTVIPFETPQSVALFGHEGIARDDPDFFAAFVMNTILGASGFNSRLMSEVREERGLTYGVYSAVVPKDFGAVIVGSMQSSNDRVSEAIEVVRAEWRRMAEEGVTEAELRTAKDYLTGAYPLRFSGNGPIANIMAGMQTSGLPVDYIATRNDKVEAVTVDDVNRVAKRLLRPDGLQFVVVGKPVGLDPSN